MIITDIFYENIPDSGMIDTLLSSGIHSDYIFENFSITLYTSLTSNEDWTGYFYRKLWETVYIHQEHTQIFGGKSKPGTPLFPTNIPRDPKVKLRITLSEAIGFIYVVTPPVMRATIPKTLVSLDQIISTLKMYLTETESPEYPHYMSVFRKHIHLEPTPTHWDLGEHAKRLEFIINSQNETPSEQRGARNSELVALIMYTSVPTEYIFMKPNECPTLINPWKILCVFHAKTVDEKFTLGLLLQNNGFKVDNVHFERDSVYVKAYSPDVDLPMTGEQTHMIELLKHSYRAIL